MIGFDYTYISSHEIIEKTKLITEYSVIDIIVLSILILCTIFTIYYVIPYLNIYFNYSKKKAEKDKRMEMARKIILQREIDEKLIKQLNIK